MNLQLHSTGASFVAAKEKHNPRDLVVDVIGKMPSADRKEQFEAFRELLAKRRDEYQRSVDWYFFVNMHDYMTSNRNRHQDPVERTESRAQKQERVEAVIAQIELLDLTMPNGKAMRDCTGADMARFGNRYQRIAERVGKGKLVGSVLNEEQVRKIIA